MNHKLEFRAMGCQVLAVVENPTALEALQGIPAWFEEWEGHLSRFRLESELTRVNRANGMPVKVSQVFADVFETALDAEHISGGLVTPVLLDALVNAGYDRSFDLLPREQAFASAEELTCIPRLGEVDWDKATRTMWLPPDLHLDFGGVAKGWAAHQAAKRLASYGAALVDAGGDIAITGLQSDGSPWLVGIADPYEPSENLEVLKLGRCGVATSGRDARNWLRGGKLSHHIIDPRTGLPAETDVLTATVVAPSVTEAEAAAKTLLISGSAAGMQWLAARPHLSAMLVLEDGVCLYSETMATFLSR
jgi:thiamine biosynthesis lipoprotein